MSTSARSEMAWRLAVLASLAVRVEPQLLRRLRLACAPELDASAEAALWFSSDLVSMRAPTGLVLDSRMLPSLRAALAQDEAMLDVVWTVTTDAHAAAAPALRLEEELTYLAVRGLHRPGAEARARTLLRSAVRTMVERGDRLAGWADRAMPRLPPAVLMLEEARMVAHGAALRLGRASPIAALGTEANADAWGWLAPNVVSRIPMSIRWVDGGIEFGPPGALLAHAVDLPALLPLAVHVWPDGPEAGPGERVQLRPAQLRFVPIPAGTGYVVVQLLGGARIVLRRPDNGIAAKLRRVRRPRVHISFETEKNGENVARELPFVVGVLGGFGGHRPAREAQPWHERSFIQVDHNNFDNVLAQIGPVLTLPDSSGGSFAIAFHSLRDFEPGPLANRIDRLRPFLEERRDMLLLQDCVDRSSAVERLLNDLLSDRAASHRAAIALADPSAPMPAEAEQLLAAGVQAQLPHLSGLLRTAVRRLFAQGSVVSGGVTQAIGVLLSDGDARLSAELNHVMHQPDFLQLEGRWRGLHHLVATSETSALLKIRVLDVSKAEIASDLYGGVAEGWLHVKLYNDEFGIVDGEPYSILVCDAEWDGSEADLHTLERLGALGARIQAPVLSAAAPAILGLRNWGELNGRPDLSTVSPPVEPGWSALRDSDNSRYLVLTLPRVLARLPYGAATNPVEEFGFEEAAGSAQPERLCWMNTASVLAGRVADASARDGLAIRFRGSEGGGKVENLPLLLGPEGAMVTEVDIFDKLEFELTQLGFVSLSHTRSIDYAVFFGAQTMARPRRYDRDEATSNAAIATRLPFMLATGRFMHYLMIIARDKIGSFSDRDDLARWLNRWIGNYVSGDDHAGQEMRARYPLREARVNISSSEDAGQDGTEDILVAYLRPWLHEETLTTSYRVIAPLSGSGPSAAG